MKSWKPAVTSAGAGERRVHVSVAENLPTHRLAGGSEPGRLG